MLPIRLVALDQFSVDDTRPRTFRSRDIAPIGVWWYDLNGEQKEQKAEADPARRNILERPDDNGSIWPKHRVPVKLA